MYVKVELAHVGREIGCSVIFGGVPVQFEICDRGVDGDVPALATADTVHSDKLAIVDGLHILAFLINELFPNQSEELYIRSTRVVPLYKAAPSLFPFQLKQHPDVPVTQAASPKLCGPPSAG